MLEEFAWFIGFIFVFFLVHYQFKYCIPITLWSLKFFEACFIILLAKFYIVFRVYGEQIDLSSLQDHIQNFIRIARDEL